MNCELTDDKEKLANSDYVLVKYKSDLEFRDLPRQANPKTRLTLYMPHPIRDLRAAKKFNGVFNLTATYHLESYVSPHSFAKARFFWTSPNENEASLRFFHLKRSVAALVDFDCSSKAAKKYMRYLRELNKTIRVRIFGRCGQWPCRSNLKTCRERIYQAYKFTLVYEPFVRCAGYVNDMFLEALAYETIPVVFNRSAHDLFVPTSAFVRAYELENARALGLLLRSIERDAVKAARFFAWKKHVKFSSNVLGSFCDLCIKAHLESSALSSNSSQVVENLEEFLRCK